MSQRRMLSMEQVDEIDIAMGHKPFVGSLIATVRVKDAECVAMREVMDAVKNWRYGLIDKQTHGDVGSIACAYPAIYRLATTFDELEHVIYPEDAHGERTCNNDGQRLTREQL